MVAVDRSKNRQPLEMKRPTLNSYIGARIRERRLKLDLSQEQLAKALSVSQQQIQNYEKGVNEIAAVRLFEICRVLKLPLSTMFPPDDLENEPPV